MPDSRALGVKWEAGGRAPLEPLPRMGNGVRGPASLSSTSMKRPLSLDDWLCLGILLGLTVLVGLDRAADSFFYATSAATAVMAFAAVQRPELRREFFLLGFLLPISLIATTAANHVVVHLSRHTLDAQMLKLDGGFSAAIYHWAPAAQVSASGAEHRLLRPPAFQRIRTLREPAAIRVRASVDCCRGAGAVILSGVSSHWTRARGRSNGTAELHTVAASDLGAAGGRVHRTALAMVGDCFCRPDRDGDAGYRRALPHRSDRRTALYRRRAGW